MKVLFYILILTDLICANSKFILPDWFKYENLPQEENVIVGYGFSDVLEVAINKAKADVVQKLSSSVQSVYSSHKIQDKKFQNKTISKTDIYSKAILYDIKVIQKEYNSPYWFVAVSYENSSTTTKLLKGIKEPCKNIQKNQFLLNSIFALRIRKEISCVPNFYITRENNIWFINLEKNRIPLSDIEDLFAIKNTDVEIIIYDKTNKRANSFKHLEKFNIEIKSDQRYYVSLFDLMPNGEVYKIFENKQISYGESIYFPEKNKKLLATIEDINSNYSNDLLVALYSKQPIDRSTLVHFDINRPQSAPNSSFLFDKFLDIVDTHNYSSILLKIDRY
jgi:hypothetical protein